MNMEQSVGDRVRACFSCQRFVPAPLRFCPACGADLRAGRATTATPMYAARAKAKSTGPLPPLELVMSPPVPQDGQSPALAARRGIMVGAAGLVLLLLIALAVPNIGRLVPAGQTVNRVGQAAESVLTTAATAFGPVLSPTHSAPATMIPGATDAAAAAEPATTFLAATATSAPTPTLVPTTAILSPLATSALTPALTLPPSAVSGSPMSPARAIVNVKYLNVRRDPSTRYPPLAVAVKGQTFNIVGRNAAGDWWQICCLPDGRAGWVATEMVTTEGALETVPVVPGE